MSGQERAPTVEQALSKAAIKWWEAKRPPGWDEAQHLKKPTVNCRTPAERDLAQAIAWYVEVLRP